MNKSEAKAVMKNSEEETLRLKTEPVLFWVPRDYKSYIGTEE